MNKTDISLSSLYPGFLKSTMMAAIASFDYAGKGDEKLADLKAVNAMRASLNNLPISGTIVIGEGERDEAPMLYIGEKVGLGGIEVDIALDPLEGTTICATNNPNSSSVLAYGRKGSFLHAPDVYMEKIAVAGDISHGEISLANSLTENVKKLAAFRKKSVSEVNVAILKRDRHDVYIKELRDLNCNVTLIGDCDVASAIAAASFEYPLDLYYGIGGAPEGVLAAAALRTLDGYFEGRLVFPNDSSFARAETMGIMDKDRIYQTHELAGGDDVVFIATGVTSGYLLDGVHKDQYGTVCQSLVLTCKDKLVQKITTRILS